MAAQSLLEFVNSFRYINKDIDSFLLQREGSIREQIIFADEFVTALHDKEVLPVKGKLKLLIVGGGVTGCTVALKASQLGSEVTLMDCEEKLFSLQANCKTRWLHPYEYDWPLAHFEQKKYPYKFDETLMAPSQMHWQAGKASEIAEIWHDKILDSKWDWQKGTYGVLTVVNQASVDVKYTGETLELRYNREETLSPDDGGIQIPEGETYNAVLVCLGRRERVIADCGNYRGYKYWHSDPFCKPRCERPFCERPTKILIVGSGDGAIQELFRLMFKCEESGSQYTHLIYKRLKDELRGCIDLDALIKSLKEYSSTQPFRVPRDKFHELFSKFIMTVDGEQIRNRLNHALQMLTHKEVIERKRIIFLTSLSDKLSEAFSLNALIAYLILFSASSKNSFLYRRLYFISKAEVTKIWHRAPHVCDREVKECHLARHRVLVRRTKFGTTKTVRCSFDVVISRMGSKPTVAPPAVNI